MLQCGGCKRSFLLDYPTCNGCGCFWDDKRPLREREMRRWQTFPKDFPRLVEPWRKRLLDRWRAVAAVERDWRPGGTGFLIAHDLFLTNNHVIPSPDVLPRIQLVFHCERYPEGTYGLTPHGVSPLRGGVFHTSPLGRHGENRNELDYTIIQITTPYSSYTPPDAVILAVAASYGVCVKPIKLRRTPVRVGGETVLIHHPGGGNKKVEIDARIEAVGDVVVRHTANAVPRPALPSSIRP